VFICTKREEKSKELLTVLQKREREAGVGSRGSCGAFRRKVRESSGVEREQGFGDVCIRG